MSDNTPETKPAGKSPSHVVYHVRDRGGKTCCIGCNIRSSTGPRLLQREQLRRPGRWLSPRSWMPAGPIQGHGHVQLTVAGHRRNPLASATQRNPVTVVMNWDGKNVTGIINPGPDSIPIASVFVDVTSWAVRIEADAPAKSAKPIHISAEGRVEDRIGSGQGTGVRGGRPRSGFVPPRLHHDHRLGPAHAAGGTEELAHVAD